MIKKYRKLYWTEHSKAKMKQYGLSKNKLINLLYKPERKENGIVFGTTAVMQTNKLYPSSGAGSRMKKNSLANSGRIKKAPGEIWLMYKDVKDYSQGAGQVRKIISAWRYPGISKSGQEIPIPKDIRLELLRDGYK